MIMNMNEKGRQTKLLAAIAIIAMVVCAFAVVMPSNDVQGLPSGIADNVDDSNGNLEITSENVKDYANGIYNTDSKQALTITISEGVELVIEATNFGIYANGNIVINGPGTLSVTVTGQLATTYGGYGAYGIYAEGGTVAINTNSTILVNVTESNGTYTANGNTSVGIAGTSVTITADADIYAGNRGIVSAGTMTIGSNTSAADVTVGAYERGIRGTGNNAKLVVTGNSTLDAVLLTGASGVNEQGNDDRFGVKTANIDVDAGSTLSTDGMRLFHTGSTVDGTVNIKYVSYGGSVATDSMAAIPAGLVLISGTQGSHLSTTLVEILINTTGALNVESGNAIIGVIQGESASNYATTIGTVTGASNEADYKLSYVNAGTDGVQFTKGSLVINGTFTGSEETGTIVIAGTATISGSVGSGVTVVTDGATVSVTEGKSLAVYGTISGPLEVPTGSKVTAYSGADVTGTEFTGNGEIDLSAASEEFSINGGTYVSKEVNYDINQIVTLTGNLYLTSGSVMTVSGEFIIAEGANLYIQEGSQLIINGSAAKLTVDGGLYVETFVNSNFDASSAYNGALFVNNGTVAVNGTMDISNPNNEEVTADYTSAFIRGTVTVDGTLTVQEEALLRLAATSVVTINADGTMNINGTIYSGMTGGQNTTYNNNGQIVINGIVYQNNMNISIASAGAVVTVTNLSGKNVVIDDMGMKLNATDKVTAGNNTVTITPGDADVAVSGITVTSQVSTETKDGRTTYYNEMVLSGSISAAFTETKDGTANATITVTGPRILITGTVTLGTGITLDVNGTLTVSGTVTATTQASDIANDGGKIVVKDEGSIQVRGDAQGRLTRTNTNLEAVEYSITTAEGTPYYYYTTLETAMANGATTIEMYGNMTILEDVTIPSGTTVYYNGAISIGDEDHTEVTVTVADGGRLLQRTGASIDVNGTLVVTNSTTGISRNANITSEVVTTVEPMVTYTNLMAALSTTTTGTIKLSDDAKITGNAVLASGVTLDTDSHTLTVSNGATFTVDGTLYLNGVSSTLTITPRMNGNTVVAESKVVVNGTVQSLNNLTTYSSQIAGGYYSIEDNRLGLVYYIQPVEDAVTKIADAYMDTVAVYGENSVGDISLTGTATERAILNVYGDLTASSITITDAQVNLQNDSVFTGAIASAAGAVEITNVNGINVYSVETGDNAGTYISGTPAQAETEGADAAIAISTGVVNVNGTYNAGDITQISEGATLIVDGQNYMTYDVLTVFGTLSVTDGGNVSIDTAAGAKGRIEIIGTLDVAETTTDAVAGTVTAKVLIVGGQLGDYQNLGASAVVNGMVAVNQYMAVVSGSTVDVDITDAFSYSTELYVENALWMTLFSKNNTNTNVTVDKIPVPNVEFKGWNDADGKPYVDATGEITVGEEEALYSSIKYDIYTVKIYADNGIGTVAIDGIVMANESGNVFTANVIAGEHTITYILKSGYEGTAVMTVNGTQASGYTFTASGTTEADTNITITLTGITASEGTSGGSGTGSSDDSLGLTDYLLIVLVILIVIMAIIVALRLMRS